MTEEEALEDVVNCLWDTAHTIFVECGAETDFGHQGELVFGATNRIMLTPRGWVADRSYCTERFLEEFDRLMAGE